MSHHRKICDIGEGYMGISGFRKLGFNRIERITDEDGQERRGDFVIYSESGTPYNAEVKTENNTRPNIPVEVWQDADNKTSRRGPGWIKRNTMGDLLFLVRLKDERVDEVWMIDFHWLRGVYRDFGQYHWVRKYTRKGFGNTELRLCPLGPNYHWMYRVEKAGVPMDAEELQREIDRKKELQL